MKNVRQLYDKRDAFPFSIVHMSYLEGNISDINTFITLASHFLEGMQKQGSKHRFIISILNNLFHCFCRHNSKLIKLFIVCIGVSPSSPQKHHPLFLARPYLIILVRTCMITCCWPNNM